MKLTDGLFLKVATDVAKDYPHIEFNNMIVDNWYVLFLLHLLSLRDKLGTLIFFNLLIAACNWSATHGNSTSWCSQICMAQS